MEDSDSVFTLSLFFCACYMIKLVIRFLRICGFGTVRNAEHG